MSSLSDDDFLDRKWNDPPVLSHDLTTNKRNNSPKKTPLNKRVAFPLSALITTPAVNAAVLLSTENGPPTSPVKIYPPALDTSKPQTVPLLVPNLSPTGTTTLSLPNTNTTQSAELGVVLDRLDKLLEMHGCANEKELLERIVSRDLSQVFDVHRDNMEVRAQEAVRQKLEAFYDIWRQRKLSEPVMSRMAQLASALVQGMYERAFDIHLSLMVDYTTEVNQWMVGVKKLINEARQCSIAKDTMISESDNTCSDPAAVNQDITTTMQEDGNISATVSDTGADAKQHYVDQSRNS